MSNVAAIEVIDFNQLSLVTGGNGPAENVGRQIGETAGRLGAELVPPVLRPPARQVLPPVGREVGGQIGRFVDRINPFR